MINFAQAKRTIDELWSGKPADPSLTLDTPVQFDATLVARLVAEHHELNTRFAVLVGRIDDDPVVTARAVRECAGQLHELRRTEALWLYPVIARGTAHDPVTRKRFLQSRLGTLGLARRVLRRFDELTQALRRGTHITATATEVSKALTEYRQRNEAEIYPLYEQMAKLRTVSAVRVA